MRAAIRWPAIICSLLALNVAIVSITLRLAFSDPSGSVEPGYYERALAWDDLARQRDASARLGWRASVVIDDTEGVVLTLSDAEGVPVSGGEVKVEAFASGRAGKRQYLRGQETAPGRYTVPVVCSLAGMWTYRVEARKQESLFLWSTEVEVTAEQVLRLGVLAAGSVQP